MIETFFADLRSAFAAGFDRSPDSRQASLLTLALGIGATTSIFSVIDGVLLKPLPLSGVRAARRRSAHPRHGLNMKEIGMTASLYVTYSEENRVFEDVGMWSTDTASITPVWASRRNSRRLLVTNRFLVLSRLRVHNPWWDVDSPPGDDDPRSQRTVILSNGYWRSRFGGDRFGDWPPNIGRSHRARSGRVLPPSFQFMDREVSLVIPLRFYRNEVGPLINFKAIRELQDSDPE